MRDKSTLTQASSSIVSRGPMRYTRTHTRTRCHQAAAAAKRRHLESAIVVVVVVVGVRDESESRATQNPPRSHCSAVGSRGESDSQLDGSQSCAVDTRWQWVAAGSEDEERLVSESPQRCSRVAAAAAASWIAASWSARGGNGAEGGGGRRARRACDSACQRSLLLLLAATAWIASLELGTRRQWLARQRRATRAAVALLAAAGLRRWLSWLLLRRRDGRTNRRRWRSTSERKS